MLNQNAMTESAEEGVERYEVTTTRTSTVRNAAAPQQLFMAPMGLAMGSACLTLLLSTVMYMAGAPGGPIWLGLLPLGHIICISLASWDIHVVTIVSSYFNVPSPRESVIPSVRVKNLPPRMYPT